MHNSNNNNNNDNGNNDRREQKTIVCTPSSFGLNDIQSQNSNQLYVINILSTYFNAVCKPRLFVSILITSNATSPGESFIFPAHNDQVFKSREITTAIEMETTTVIELIERRNSWCTYKSITWSVEWLIKFRGQITTLGKSSMHLRFEIIFGFQSNSLFEKTKFLLIWVIFRLIKYWLVSLSTVAN